LEKKRREKNCYLEGKDTLLKIDNFRNLCTLEGDQSLCGVTSKRYRIKENIGVGLLQSYTFEGLYISIYDFQLKQDAFITGRVKKEYFELNYLVEGEQIIKVDHLKDDIVLEDLEFYSVYIDNLSGGIYYPKNKHIRALNIKMSTEFINRHQLNLELELTKKHHFEDIDFTSFIKPQCDKTQTIIASIFENRHQGLLKRLFLESKVLELFAIQLSAKNDLVKKSTKVQNNKIVKKLYEVQHLIASDLSKQFTIQELSKHISINDFLLKKEFKRVFNKTVFQYATELRMEKAKELLLHTKKPIYEISEIIGYKNPTHFTAAFKKIEGITPKKFRT